jgi:hypothetical protein
MHDPLYFLSDSYRKYAGAGQNDLSPPMATEVAQQEAVARVAMRNDHQWAATPRRLPPT